jgi:hypothetical protein
MAELGSDSVVDLEKETDVAWVGRQYLLSCSCADSRLGMHKSISRAVALVIAIARCRSSLRFDQVLQLIHEFFYVLEIEVNRGKTNIGHLVVAAQTIHDQLTEFAGFSLPLR